jgi:hypothetical protein
MTLPPASLAAAWNRRDRDLDGPAPGPPASAKCRHCERRRGVYGDRLSYPRT